MATPKKIGMVSYTFFKYGTQPLFGSRTENLLNAASQGVGGGLLLDTDASQDDTPATQSVPFNDEPHQGNDVP